MPQSKPQLSRLFFIDEKIQKGGYPNCYTLAKEYEVTARTIARDIEYMRDMMNAPIGYDPARKGYFYTEANFRLPAIDIRESELFAICLAEKALAQYAGSPLHARLAAVFDRIRSFLPGETAVKASWVGSHISMVRESTADIDPEIWETVADGLRAGLELIIDYHAAEGKQSRRTVRPYHMASYRGDWYLVAYCLKRKNILTFAISRIVKVQITKIRFSVPEDFDFNEFMGSRFGIMNDSKEYTVKIWFNAREAAFIRERTWHESQEIREQKDGSLILTFTTSSLLEVKRWILSHGAGARVLAPESLKQEIKSEMKKAYNNY